MKRSVTEVAELCRKPVQTVHDWTRGGLRSAKPGRNRVVEDEDLIRFLAARDYEPGSQRDRLAKAQAIKVELANAQRRGELIFADQVAEALSTLAADLSARHDALPGRLANELAGLTDPAVIRSRLLDELRAVRGAFADASAKLADTLGSGTDDGDDQPPAEEEVSEPVGGRKPRAAARKRGARPVAQ